MDWAAYWNGVRPRTRPSGAADVLALFLGLATVPDAESAVPSSELYTDYVELCAFIRAPAAKCCTVLTVHGPERLHAVVGLGQALRLGLVGADRRGARRDQASAGSAATAAGSSAAAGRG